MEPTDPPWENNNSLTAFHDLFRTLKIESGNLPESGIPTEEDVKKIKSLLDRLSGIISQPLPGEPKMSEESRMWVCGHLAQALHDSGFGDGQEMDIIYGGFTGLDEMSDSELFEMLEQITDESEMEEEFLEDWNKVKTELGRK